MAGNTIYPRLSFTPTPDGLLVRSLVKPRRGETYAGSLVRRGRWPNGDMLTGSDQYDIARAILPPCGTKRAAVARR